MVEKPFIVAVKRDGNFFFGRTGILFFSVTLVPNPVTNDVQSRKKYTLFRHSGQHTIFFMSKAILRIFKVIMFFFVCKPCIL